jgi:hypothetical protein
MHAEETGLVWGDRHRMREVSASERSLHALIRQAEDMAGAIRVLSGGYLSLAVVRNHGVTPTEREGLGWQEAHETAARVFTAPDSITDAVLDDAVRAYRVHERENRSKATGGQRNCMTAALTAANLYEPEYLDVAMKAFRSGYHGIHGSLRHALDAVLAERKLAGEKNEPH